MVEWADATEHYLVLLGCLSDPKLWEAHKWVMTWLGMHLIAVEFFGVGLDEERVLN